MRITCPSCQTNYEVPASRLGSGPAVARCAKCQREFAVNPPDAPEPAPFEPVVMPAPPEPVPFMPVERAPEPPRVPLANPFRAAPETEPAPLTQPRRGALIGWVVSIVALVALVALAVVFRNAIMAAWLPSQRLFHLFGSR